MLILPHTRCRQLGWAGQRSRRSRACVGDSHLAGTRVPLKSSSHAPLHHALLSVWMQGELVRIATLINKLVDMDGWDEDQEQELFENSVSTCLEVISRGLAPPHYDMLHTSRGFLVASESMKRQVCHRSDQHCQNESQENTPNNFSITSHTGTLSARHSAARAVHGWVWLIFVTSHNQLQNAAEQDQHLSGFLHVNHALREALTCMPCMFALWCFFTGFVTLSLWQSLPLSFLFRAPRREVRGPPDRQLGAALQGGVPLPVHG